MSANKTHISRIRKYLAGELDARAMHQLEREAQDDPFLMDAIEGYSGQPDQHAQLAELQRKLQQRAAKSKAYPFPYRTIMAIAASALIILSAAYLLWPAKQQARVQQMAEAIPKTPVPQTGPDTLLKPAGKQTAVTAAVPATVLPQPELSQAGTTSSAADISTISATSSAINTNARKTDSTAHATLTYQPKPSDSLNTGVALAAAKQPAVPGANNSNPEPARMMRAAVMAKSTTKINGIVSDETGHPLAGASITEKGKPEGVKTDSKGKFSLPGQDGDLLSITAQGYDSKEIKGDIHDSLNVILRSADKTISEIVAIGFGQALAAQKIKTAHPQIGWDNYNDYLKGRAIITDGKPGTVRLSFTVDAKGQLDNFKITKILSPAADQLAISLVKDGPPWSPAVNGATKTISLKIEFKLKQP